MVIGRSCLNTQVSVFLQEHPFADLSYSQGEHGQHSRIEISVCTQGEHNPLPLMKKGENDLGSWILVLPSSPKGEIVGIMAQVWSYGTGVFLDGNLLW